MTSTWLQYLSAHPLADQLWVKLTATGIVIRLPLAQSTEEGGIFFAWDEGPHHLDIDLLTNGKLEWFYRHCDSGVHAGDEDMNEIDEKLMEYLQLFEVK